MLTVFEEARLQSLGLTWVTLSSLAYKPFLLLRGVGTVCLASIWDILLTPSLQEPVSWTILGTPTSFGESHKHPVSGSRRREPGVSGAKVSPQLGSELPLTAPVEGTVGVLILLCGQ